MSLDWKKVALGYRKAFFRERELNEALREQLQRERLARARIDPDLVYVEEALTQALGENLKMSELGTRWIEALDASLAASDDHRCRAWLSGPRAALIRLNAGAIAIEDRLKKARLELDAARRHCKEGL